MIPKDYNERLAAALPGDQNIIVEAGAGTGKTTLLADRLCYLILGKGLKTDEIVALTFTDKAAAEIKLRLMQTMRNISLDLTLEEPKLETTKNLLRNFNKTKEELIKNIENSFELIERASICTIHSFALQILRLYPLEAGLAPDMEIDSGFVADYIFNKNWSVFLEEELSLGNPHRALWERILQDFTLDKLKDFALLLREPYFDYCSFTNSPEEIVSFLANKISCAKNLLISKLGEKKPRKVESSLQEAIKRLETLLKNISALNKKELLALPDQEDIDKGSSVKDWTKEELDQANQYIDLANTLKPKNLDLLEQIYALFYSFIKKVNSEMRKMNLISYNQSILFARDLVQNNLFVRTELKKRYKSLLIDEFQDTDVAQGQLLLFLAEDKNSTAKNWQDIILEPGKLFAVGDPKQSIYRFRGANISAYEKFLELMKNQQARTCSLTVNFRSCGKIIDFVNKWGKTSIKEYPLIQPAYKNLEKSFKSEGEKVEFLQIKSEEKVLQDNLRANEANIIAAWIKDNVGTRKLANNKVLSYKDITILYKARTGIKFYTEALSRFNIPYNLEVSGNFYEAQEIIDILNILKVIYDPQDKLALIGVLRGPLCAMKDEEIISLWQQKALNIFAKNFESSQAVKNIYRFLKTLNAKAGRITLKELIEEIFYNTDFLVLQMLANRNEQVLANLNKFKQIVLENASKGFTLGQMLLYIQTYGKTDKEEGQSSLVEENFDVVNMMTIHKAKGLQAPVIILIDTGYKEKSAKEDYYIDTLSCKIGLSLGNLKNLNYFILEEKENLHNKAQNERLLYVALTRAEEKLLIGVSEQETQGTIEKSLRKSGCYPAQKADISELFETTNFDYKDPQSFLFQTAQTLTKDSSFDWSEVLPRWRKRKEDFLTYQQKEILEPSHAYQDEKSAQQALDIGILVHKVLNIYFTTGLFDLPSAAKLTGIEDSSSLLYGGQIIDAFAKSYILKNLKTLRFADSEIPFSMYEEGLLVNGVIDALFEDNKGTLFIVDFKTDKIDISELENHSLKYVPQMTLYKRAVEKMFKTDKVKTILAYLRLDRLYEI